MNKKIIILAAAFIIMVVFGFLAERPAASSPKEPAGSAVQVSEQAASQFSPELLKNRVLLPAISYHPGTAGASLGCAQSSAAVASFAAEYRLRTADGDQLTRSMKDAAALLSAEEAEWLQENLPGLIGMIDSAYADYSTVIGVFGDAGADDMMRTVLIDETTIQDWAKLKAALIQLEGDTTA